MLVQQIDISKTRIVRHAVASIPLILWVFVVSLWSHGQTQLRPLNTKNQRLDVEIFKLWLYEFYPFVIFDKTVLLNGVHTRNEQEL